MTFFFLIMALIMLMSKNIPLAIMFVVFALLFGDNNRRR